MCGVCGIYEYKTHKPVDQQCLAGMLSVLHHRGPDDAGVFFDKDVALAMRRLSIIDLDGGKQPISNEDGSITTVFNGEIYNYQSLQEELEGRGHRLRTASDTEVIVHLYEDLGEECVQHLRGMFGFALWDAPKRRHLLSRYRLGIKTL
jgi:asparagine synthase (glutamine-hydrolysing)